MLSVFQTFVEESESSWCFFPSGDSLYGVLMRKTPSSFSSIYQWRGIFVPIEVNSSFCFVFVLIFCFLYAMEAILTTLIYDFPFRISVSGILRAV